MKEFTYIINTVDQLGGFGPLQKFWESKVSTEKSKLDFGARYISGFEDPSFNIYSVGAMMRDVLGFSRKQAKDAFTYWVAYNEEFKIFADALSTLTTENS